MILADIHTHTSFSHGRNTVREMFVAGQSKGLKIHGFSEHSPRPLGYDYVDEYRDKLNAHFQQYIQEVRELAAEEQAKPHGSTVLLGLEMDWLENELPFMRQVLADYNFDYVIGGLHFLGTWGFDASAADWDKLDQETKEKHYADYYRSLSLMAQSRLFNVAAHPDLIKIFSRDTFSAWISRPDSQDLIAQALKAIKNAGMAMEVSSAGLRKVCREIYPGPQIMALARDLGLEISFASDAHTVQDMANNFDLLAKYAKSYGFRHHIYFNQGKSSYCPF